MNRALDSSYAIAETVARTRARNFYYSFVVLPPEKRLALCAVYAFMRYCDDVSDGSGGLDEKRKGLEEWRARLDAAIRGQTGGAPILPAFHDTVRKFSIPGEYFHWIIDGAEMDLTVPSYRTFEELYRYCFRVASAVGLVCLQIFGYREQRARVLAERCGIAFQLTNILRDVKEDATLGRIYLPEEDLDRFGYAAADLRSGVVDERFRELMGFQARRAGEYYAQARELVSLVDTTSRPALWAMIEIYERLLKKIVRRRFDVFSARVRLSSTEKSLIALRALSMRYLGMGRSQESGVRSQ
jgi:15-cis-phytoene synthase